MSDSIKKYHEMKEEEERIELLIKEIKLSEKHLSDLIEKLNKYIK